MRKWYSVLTLTLFAHQVLAQTGDEEKQPSNAGVVIIGLLLLVVVFIILYNRQKRKFND
ncbi:MAG TPA: LPXTG cell wall anchor domain-containing protein [Sphingobacterium sp.]|nr:LPXTG cell wall anchor domain-containing protein [Sphingobacterium sp.]